jgi:signal-induced proliferation-associated 1 like protein 3
MLLVAPLSETLPSELTPLPPLPVVPPVPLLPLLPPLELPPLLPPLPLVLPPLVLPPLPLVPPLPPLPLLPLLPLVLFMPELPSVLPLPLVPVELHAASPSASKPASSTLFSIRFMIHSFGWVCCRVRDSAACH